jgi:hypothetical protein
MRTRDAGRDSRSLLRQTRDGCAATRHRMGFEPCDGVFGRVWPSGSVFLGMFELYWGTDGVHEGCCLKSIMRDFRVSGGGQSRLDGEGGTRLEPPGWEAGHGGGRCGSEKKTTSGTVPLTLAQLARRSNYHYMSK